MTLRPDLHDMLTGIRNAEGDTTVERISPEDAARLAEYHAPREPMPARDAAGDLLPADYARRCDEPARYIDLRDGGLAPADDWPWWAGPFWLAMIAAGLAFWHWIGGPALFWLFDVIRGLL